MEIREKLEKILDYFHENKFKIISDTNVKDERVVTLHKYEVYVALFQDKNEISFDVYGSLKERIYEFGELNLLTRTILNVKKMGLELGIRERNTTERLYPDDRRGNQTKTSGL
jgi:hypothetical protein